MTTTIKPSKLFHLGVLLTLLVTSAAANAEYRLSAFEKARAFEALSIQDAAAAAKTFRRLDRLPMDYADANNLCVLKLMQKDSVAAEAICKKAYKMIGAVSMRRGNQQRTRAVVLTNLAVAQALNGKEADAQATLTKAARCDADNPNVAFNLQAFARNQLAAR